MVERLAERFDEVRVVPCALEPDRHGAVSVPSTFHATLCDITFGGLARVTVDLSELEANVSSQGEALERRFSTDTNEVWHVVDAEALADGAASLSTVRPGWKMPRDAWKDCRFAVIVAPGHRPDPAKLPPRHELFSLEAQGSSKEIRDLILHGQDASHLLAPRAWDYIERYGLYRGTNPAAWSRGSLEGLKCMVRCATGNPRAKEWAAKFSTIADETDAGFIAVLGGDGTMLRGIRDHWRRRLPFFGVNAGHVGFLMNAPEQVFDGCPPGYDVIFRQLPLIYVEVQTADGAWLSTYAFNDAWVERSSSQSAWLQVQVNHVPRIEKLVCDGALVCTAAGSTAYARAMGAAPLLADTPAWLLVGSNVMEPVNWKSALLSPDGDVEITSLDIERRPVIAYVDGVAQGPVRRLRARLSRAGSVELVFLANRDMAEKIATIQFGR